MYADEAWLGPVKLKSQFDSVSNRTPTLGLINSPIQDESSSMDMEDESISVQKQAADVYFVKLINTLIYTQFQPQAHGLVK
jgi:hypothetical protein